ncbi:hypothetical protein [Oenococcus oeni]|uniref:Uncharacterized protein n=1 Tax=Oenococcus oeni TaxID=1247 RepID=A0AAJ2P1H8_OENOE|nr:hypothetical protein [Oenococcus oeni]MDV7714402.1 hypothetical protein [Oenococcus oeni]
MSLIFYVTNSYSSLSFGEKKDFIIQINSNIALIILLMMNIFQVKLKSVFYEQWYELPLFFSFFQCFVGIAQFFTKSTIVPTVVRNQNVTSNSFFLDGTSGSNSDLLGLGGILRGFGLTNAGLTLGMFALFGLALLPFLKNKKYVHFFFIFFSLAVFCTYTRVIWFGYIFFLFFEFLIKKRRYHSLTIFYIITWLTQIIYPFGSFLISQSISQNSFFSSLVSRSSGINYFSNYFPLTIKNLMFGQNFLAKIADFSSLTNYSVDNQFLVWVYNIGLFGFLIYMFVNFIIFKKMIAISLYNSKYNYLIAVLITFQIIGIFNDPSYFVVPTLIFAIYGIRNEYSVVKKINYQEKI